MNIDNSAMQHLREELARRGSTMSALVEDEPRSVLAMPEADEKQPEDLAPLPSWSGGYDPVDISSRDDLYRAMGDG